MQYRCNAPAEFENSSCCIRSASARCAIVRTVASFYQRFVRDVTKRSAVEICKERYGAIRLNLKCSATIQASAFARQAVEVAIAALHQRSFYVGAFRCRCERMQNGVCTI